MPLIRTCFILDELYPGDRGGIGRLMHNIVHDAKNRHPDLDLHILLARTMAPDGVEALQKAFDGLATLHFLGDDAAISKRLGIAGIGVSAANTASLNAVMQNGLRVLDAMLEIQAVTGPFDHIEIPDHMGLGAVLLMVREAGIAFETAQITCRLHSSLSLIMAHEPFHHPRSEWVAPRIELERYSLDKADRIIAHIPEIARLNHAHFGLDAAWLDKVETAFPPAIWPASPRDPDQRPTAPDFLFTSRFQPFKRPELFIKAAAVFLDRNPGYSGDFRLVSYGFNREYIDALRMMVPERHLDRIRLEPDQPGAVRDQAMAGAIIVQPSNFESLCTLAYEVAANRNPVLLSRDCAAFGRFERWKDGENCLMFDPDPAALADTMQAALHWTPSSAVDITPDPHYFATAASPATPVKAESPCRVLVGPLHSPADFDRFARFAETCTVPATGYAPARLAPLYPDAAHLVWLDEAGYQGAQLRQLAGKTETVVLASPDALPMPDFLRYGRKVTRIGRAFSANSVSAENGRLYIYCGKMGSMLASDYRLCPPCVMLHRDDLHLIAPDDDRDLNLRLLTRLAGADTDLTLAPTPLITEHRPLLNDKPDRRLLGYDPAGWQNGIRKIAVEVRTARHTPLLHETEIPVTAPVDLSEIRVSADTPLAIPLHLPRPLLGEILGIRIENRAPDSGLGVSLHHCDETAAISAHEQGLQTRKFAAGQRYIARWGPLWRADTLVFVATSTTDIVIKLDRFIIFSRE